MGNPLDRWRVGTFALVVAVALFAAPSVSAKRFGAGVYLQECRSWQEAKDRISFRDLQGKATNACKDFVQNTLLSKKQNTGCIFSEVACAVELAGLLRRRIAELCPPSETCQAAKANYERGVYTDIVEDPLPPQTWFCRNRETQQLDAMTEGYFDDHDAPTSDQLIRALRTSNMDPAVIAALEGVVGSCVKRRILDDLVQGCSCGNGEVEAVYEEQCDAGLANGDPASACTELCKAVEKRLEMRTPPPPTKYFDSIKDAPIYQQTPPSSEPDTPDE